MKSWELTKLCSSHENFSSIKKGDGDNPRLAQVGHVRYRQVRILISYISMFKSAKSYVITPTIKFKINTKQ